MNQRGGRFHAASMNDAGGGTVSLGDLSKFIRASQKALENENESDAALRFEILADFIEKDVINEGKPFRFTTKALGL